MGIGNGFLLNLRRANAKPAKPMPIMLMVAGSGTAWTVKTCETPYKRPSPSGGGDGFVRAAPIAIQFVVLESLPPKATPPFTGAAYNGNNGSEKPNDVVPVHTLLVTWVPSSVMSIGLCSNVFGPKIALVLSLTLTPSTQYKPVLSLSFGNRSESVALTILVQGNSEIQNGTSQPDT